MSAVYVIERPSANPDRSQRLSGIYKTGRSVQTQFVSKSEPDQLTVPATYAGKKPVIKDTVVRRVSTDNISSMNFSPASKSQLDLIFGYNHSIMGVPASAGTAPYTDQNINR